jgi:hypothetical protein
MYAPLAVDLVVAHCAEITVALGAVARACSDLRKQRAVAVREERAARHAIAASAAAMARSKLASAAAATRSAQAAALPTRGMPVSSTPEQARRRASSLALHGDAWPQPGASPEYEDDDDDDDLPYKYDDLYESSGGQAPPTLSATASPSARPVAPRSHGAGAASIRHSPSAPDTLVSSASTLPRRHKSIGGRPAGLSSGGAAAHERLPRRQTDVAPTRGGGVDIPGGARRRERSTSPRLSPSSTSAMEQLLSGMGGVHHVGVDTPFSSGA